MAVQLRLATTDELHEREEQLLKKELGPSIQILLQIQTKLRYPDFCDQLIYIPSAANHLQRSIIIVTNSTNFIRPSRKSLEVWWNQDLVSDDDLRCFFRVIPDWNWNEPFVLSCAVGVFGDKLCEIFSEEEFCGKSLHGVYETGYLMTIKKDEISHISLPPGYKKDKLYPCHMPYVLSTWQFGVIMDRDILHKMVDYLPSVAVFREKDDIMTSNPVSWCLQYKFGLMGLLYTDEACRNLGLASYVTCELAKIVIDSGYLATVFVSGDNNISIKFHQKIGFKQAVEGRDWVFFIPKNQGWNDLFQPHGELKKLTN